MQYPAANQNFKAHEISHVCFHSSVRYLSSPAGLPLSHFWEVQLVVHAGKTLKHSGKATQPATESREAKGDAKSHLSFSPLLCLLVTLFVFYPS